MKLTALMMAALLQVCGAGADRDVLLRLLRPEWPQTAFLVQNAAGEARAFEREDEAVVEIERRLATGEETWIGPMQVNAAAFLPIGYTVREGLNACINIDVAASRLVGVSEPTEEEIKARKRSWNDYQTALARYFSADPPTGQALAKRIVDDATARKPLPAFPRVPVASGEYRNAFVVWSQAKGTSARRRADAPLPP